MAAPVLRALPAIDVSSRAHRVRAGWGELDALVVSELTNVRWLTGFTVLMAALFAAMGVWQLAWLDVAGPLAVGVLSGYMVLQYADVRSSYPAAMTGRAMSVFTMALFLGVALMQWITGVAASTAKAQGAEPYAVVMFTIAGMLALGAAAFRWLPAPRQQV